MKQKKNALASPFGSVHGEERDQGGNPLDSSNEEGPQRRPRRGKRYSSNSNDFKVEISEFEGKLDPNKFSEWLHIVERIIDYKDVPEEKKVKLVACKLRKHGSL